MKKLVVCAGFVLIFGFSCTAVRGQTFPPIKLGDTSYTITAADAHGIIKTVYLPKNFTLKVAPGVTLIDWTVDTIRTEEGVTIDLSASPLKPAKAADGASVPGQAPSCDNGGAGGAGRPGIAGAPGVSLTIHNLSNFDNQGSVWIRTDGGPGGDGGNGGNGQLGGGAKTTFLNGCSAGWNGAAGAAGTGGAGGATGKVNINFKDGTPAITSGADAPGCAPTQIPAEGNTGKITIWGAPGCPGQSGATGKCGGNNCGHQG
jgi:hypothetical protein